MGPKPKPASFLIIRRAQSTRRCSSPAPLHKLPPAHPAAFRRAPFHLLRSATASPADLDYLHQLSISLFNQQLSAPSLLQALKNLKSNGLFNSLSANSFDLLLDYNPTSDQEEQSSSSHYYLYNRIFFLLDRIHELKHLFTPSQLDRFHSLALKQFSQVGLFRPAELIWDQLIVPHSAQPHPRDQMLMIDCIRTALTNHHSSQTRPGNLNHEHENQDLLPPTSKDTKHMINLTESIGNSLTSSTHINPIAERWAVRTVAEIFGIQQESSKLANWLIKTRALDIEFPDHGASWTDPKLTAIVVKMFKDQGKLENMITIFEAASHPSPTMLTHPQIKAMEEKVMFGPESNHSALATQNEQRKQNPILTRTYHDLILASSQANRPHLTIHFLTQAIERNESHVQNLVSKPASNLNFPPIPALRLQPATYSELIPNLVRKKRDTQLKTLLKLTHRLVRSTVDELNWIRNLAQNRSSAFPHETSKWLTITNSIFTHLREENHDLELEKSENLALEKIVFTHNNHPTKFFSDQITITPGTDKDDNLKMLTEDSNLEDFTQQQQPSSSSSSESPEVEEINFLRVLERTKFLTKSLIHSIKLIKRLDPMIHKTKINRAIRFESNLLNQKNKSNNIIKNNHNHPKNSKPLFFNNQNLASTIITTSPVYKIKSRIENLKLQKNLLKNN